MPKEKKLQPRQHQQPQPGREHKMKPRPRSDDEKHRGSGKLRNKVAIITGGDSGIGRAVAVAFAKEGADVAIVYLEEHTDANETKRLVEENGRRCLLVSGDVGQEGILPKSGRTNCKGTRQDRHPGQQRRRTTTTGIDRENNRKAAGANISDQHLFILFHGEGSMKHLKKAAAIINTTSVTAYKGSAHLLDYSSTKGAITAFTRSLSQALADKDIRVNGVAPGPIWTPLIPSTFPAKEVETFGSDVPLGRPGQPEEIAPSFVFLASDDSSYMTGQSLHPNGGTVVNT